MISRIDAKNTCLEYCFSFCVGSTVRLSREQCKARLEFFLNNKSNAVYSSKKNVLSSLNIPQNIRKLNIDFIYFVNFVSTFTILFLKIIKMFHVFEYSDPRHLFLGKICIISFVCDKIQFPKGTFWWFYKNK